METVMIGNKILKLRKEKNITQDILAGMVGVSAGAVSKWETGNSTPDITLLAPLARALGTTIDDLLSFSPELTEADVKNMKQNLSVIFTQSGYQAGEEACKKLLAEYPNSIFLKLTIASQLQIYSMMYAEESEEFLRSKSEYVLSLLEAVSLSGEVKYVSPALFSMASVYMILEDYDKSEATLKQLTEAYIDPMSIYPMVLQRMGKAEEAELLCEQMLLSRITQGTAMLSTMAKIAKEQGRLKQSMIYIETTQKIQQIFDIGLHTGDYNMCLYYIRTDQLELAAQAFNAYVTGVLSTEYDYQRNPYFCNIKLEASIDTQKIARLNMYKSHLNDPELKKLEGIADYEEAILLLKKQIS